MRDFLSGYIHEKIIGDGELILMTYIIVDRIEDWEKTYYKLKDLKGEKGRPAAVDIKRLYKDFQKRWTE